MGVRLFWNEDGHLMYDEHLYDSYTEVFILSYFKGDLELHCSICASLFDPYCILLTNSRDCLGTDIN